MKNLLLIISGILIAVPAVAQVFKCYKSDGSVYYQDKYCDDESDIQKELKCYTKPATKNELKRIDHRLKQYRKQIFKKRKQRQYNKKIAAKKAEAEQRRNLRLKEKCEKVKHKINQVTQRYRNGYTVVQGIALDRKLAEYQNEKRKYCINE